MRTVALDAEERPLLVCDGCGHKETGGKPSINAARWRVWAAAAGPVMAPAFAESERLGMDAIVLFHGTGLSVAEHQHRTIENNLELNTLAPDLPWIPVLQGWEIGDYERHAADYARAGIHLDRLPVVGVGSVCRRQNTEEGAEIMERIAALGIRPHGFGFKLEGLQACSHLLASADSMAWSGGARRRVLLPGHDKPGPGRPRGHKNCANCMEYALQWREQALRMKPRQLSLLTRRHLRGAA
jgi:hypothetical protein